MENYEELIGKKFTCRVTGGLYEYKGINKIGAHYFDQLSGQQAFGKSSDGTIGFLFGFPESFKLIEDGEAE